MERADPAVRFFHGVQAWGRPAQAATDFRLLLAATEHVGRNTVRVASLTAAFFGRLRFRRCGWATKPDQEQVLSIELMD